MIMRATSTALAFPKKLHYRAFSLLLILSLSSPALAGVGAGKSQGGVGLPEAEVSGVESKLLQKTFAQDPIEKRLQRLELLVFGATQFGTTKERWQQLNSALAEQKKEQLSRRPGQRQGKVGGKGEDVAILEREVLKKTFANEPVGKRLDRLENKVFGQSTGTMAAESRVERLKRTIGLPEAQSGPQTAISPYGGEPGLRSGLPLGRPFGGQVLPGFPEFGQSDPQMRELLRQMEQQMRGLDQFGNGQINPNMPKNGQFSFRYFYQGPDGKPHYYESPNAKPDSNPGFKGQKKPLIPGLKVPNTNEIPPYGDPNSI
jgi:hypothetical protein